MSGIHCVCAIIPISFQLTLNVLLYLFLLVFAQIHRTLFHHHTAVLLLPGLFWGRSFLPGPHRHCCGEAAHPGRPGNLVVCGLDPAHNWWPDAQWLQQLVHLLLRPTTECDWGLCPLLIQILSVKSWELQSVGLSLPWLGICGLACSKGIYSSAVQSGVQRRPQDSYRVPRAPEKNEK